MYSLQQGSEGCQLELLSWVVEGMACSNQTLEQLSALVVHACQCASMHVERG